MKRQTTTVTTGLTDHALESDIQKRDTELKELAQTNARHFAKRNLPSPTGDKLIHYTGELKAGYEKLASDISKRLQPESHLPEGKMDLDYANEQDGNFKKEIRDEEDQIHNTERDLGNFDPSHIYSRIRWIVILTIIIMTGEILFNSKAFQVTGENMLFALILSVSVTISVFVFSHLASFLYKAAKNKFQRRMVVALTLSLVTLLFIALAIFRSQYLASHDVTINPIYFVVINMFFFIVSWLLSFSMLPTWLELKEAAVHLKLYKSICKRKKRIEQLKNEKEKMKAKNLEDSKHRIRTIHYAQYSRDTVRKMYFETVETFIRTNLTYRTDRKVPDCFSDVRATPDIPDFTFNVNHTNGKLK